MKENMIKHKEQRVGVLVDVSNMYHSAKNIYNSRVNFKEVLKTAVAGRKLVNAIAYVITSPNKDEAMFFEALSKSGFKIKTKDLQIFPGGAKKADWDVGIVIDAIRMVPSVDVLVVVSGDGDFIALVEYLKNQGKRVEVMAFGRSASSRLKESADEFIDLGNPSGKYLLKK